MFRGKFVYLQADNNFLRVMKKDNSFINDDTVVIAAEPATSADQTEVSQVRIAKSCK